MNKLPLGGARGAGVLLEKELDSKCPGFGCQLHVVERYEDAAMRTVYGPTTSPEEGFSKKFKTWANSTTTRTTENVISETCLVALDALLFKLCNEINPQTDTSLEEGIRRGNSKI